MLVGIIKRGLAGAVGAFGAAPLALQSGCLGKRPVSGAVLYRFCLYGADGTAAVHQCQPRGADLYAGTAVFGSGGLFSGRRGAECPGICGRGAHDVQFDPDGGFALQKEK